MLRSSSATALRTLSRFNLHLDPPGEVFRGAGEEAEQKRDLIEAALATAISKQKIGTFGIMMDSSSWVITGTNPHS